MEIVTVITLLAVIGAIVNQQSMNKKLNDIYTEVAEIHEKMGGWFSDQD